jgi:hypothetical protein
LIPAETVWKYRADGIDLGLAWRGAAFDDAAWQSAQAEIGFGDGGERTALALGQAPTTIYFRRSFEVSNPSAFKSLLLRFIRDDGAVFYLNGVELFRSNMPEGNIDSSTSAVAESNIHSRETIFWRGSPPRRSCRAKMFSRSKSTNRSAARLT